MAGYGQLNKEPFIQTTLETRGFQALFSKQRLAEWTEKNNCPENDKLCQEANWLAQTVLLGSRTDMEQIASAIARIQAHAPELAKE